MGFVWLLVAFFAGGMVAMIVGACLQIASDADDAQDLLP